MALRLFSMSANNVNRHVKGRVNNLESQVKELQAQLLELQDPKKDVENIKGTLGTEPESADAKRLVEPRKRNFWSTRIGKGLKILGIFALVILVLLMWDIAFDLPPEPLAFCGAALILWAVFREYLKNDPQYRTPPDILWPFAGVLGAMAVLISSGKAWLGESTQAYVAVAVALIVVGAMLVWSIWVKAKVKVK